MNIGQIEDLLNIFIVLWIYFEPYQEFSSEVIYRKY